MNRHGEIVIVDDTGREREHHRLVYGAVLKIRENDKVKAGQLLAEWTRSPCRSARKSQAS